MSLDVIAVTARSDFQLDLVFANGENRRFDMKPLLRIKPWIRLADTHYLNSSVLIMELWSGLEGWILLQKLFMMIRSPFSRGIWPFVLASAASRPLDTDAHGQRLDVKA